MLHINGEEFRCKEYAKRFFRGKLFENELKYWLTRRGAHVFHIEKKHDRKEEPPIINAPWGSSNLKAMDMFAWYTRNCIAIECKRERYCSKFNGQWRIPIFQKDFDNYCRIDASFPFLVYLYIAIDGVDVPEKFQGSPTGIYRQSIQKLKETPRNKPGDKRDGKIYINISELEKVATWEQFRYHRVKSKSEKVESEDI